MFCGKLISEKRMKMQLPEERNFWTGKLLPVKYLCSWIYLENKFFDCFVCLERPSFLHLQFIASQKYQPPQPNSSRQSSYVILFTWQIMLLHSAFPAFLLNVLDYLQQIRHLQTFVIICLWMIRFFLYICYQHVFMLDFYHFHQAVDKKRERDSSCHTQRTSCPYFEGIWR